LTNRNRLLFLTPSTPEMKYKEDSLQISVATYLDYLNITWCHVANERKTSPQAGARLKNKGVKSGVPDCVIFEPKGTTTA